MPTDATANLEQIPVFEIIDHLLAWKNTYKDQSNNFDARLLGRAAELLEDLQLKVNELEGENDDLTVAYVVGVEHGKKIGGKK